MELMLKITNQHIHSVPESSSHEYTTEQQSMDQLQKHIARGQFKEIQDNLQSLPSISAKCFASVMSKAIESVAEKNLPLLLNILLRLIEIPHSAREVRQQLKTSHKIDSILVLAVMWTIRDNPISWKYVNLMIDTFPVEVMMQGKPYLTQWSIYIRQNIDTHLARERLGQQLAKKKGKVTNNSQFEQILIPL